MKNTAKRFICLVLCLIMLTAVFAIVASATDDTQFSKSTTEFVKGMTAGWNLGNTFESCDVWGDVSAGNPTPTQVESAWGNPVTTQAMIDKVAQTGFNAIRIPITWYIFTTESNGIYSIDPAWIARIKEVVGYAYNNNMYVILNMHHDDQIWLDISKTGVEWEKIKEKYQAIWEIVAESFKDYDEMLLFEGTNEVKYLDDWWGQEQVYFNKSNEIHKIFVDAVRASGGNNDKRYLIIPTYGAQWYDHQVSKIVVPNGDDHVIVDIHWYTTSTNVDNYHSYFSKIKRILIDKGIAVIIGECGVRRTSSEASKTQWAGNYIKIAAEYGIKCFLWDDGGDFRVLTRKTVTWTSDAFVNAVILNANLGSANPVTTITQTTTDATSPQETTTFGEVDPTTKKTYFKFTQTNFHWGKCEGWYESSLWIEGTKSKITYLADGSFKLTTSMDINQGYDFYSQYNIAFNNIPSSTEDIYIDIKNNLNQPAKVKVSVPGYSTPDDSVLPIVNAGETLTLKLGVLRGGDLQLMLQRDEEVLPIGNDQFVVSPLYTATEKPIESTTNTTSTTTTSTTTTSTTTTSTTTEPTVPTGVTTASSTATTEITTNTEIPTSTGTPNIIYGDVNSDTNINAKDTMLLRQFLASWDVEIDTVAADVNLDNIHNAKDTLLIRKYIAKYDVKLGVKQ